MLDVVLMQGVSGAGKSTIARKLTAGHLSSRIVSADDYFMRDGVYEYDATKQGAAHGLCLRNFIGMCMTKTQLIIVDNVNARELNMAPYMAVAEAYGYDATILRVMCDVDKAHARNTHGASFEQVVRWNADIFTRHLPPWWKVKTFNSDTEEFS